VAARPMACGAPACGDLRGRLETLRTWNMLQVPSVWRPLIEDSATLQLCFDFYAATKPPLSNAALECLVGILGF
jgi:hypothetical protein